MKKGFIITAVVLIVAGIALFTAALAAAGFDFSKLSGEKYETNTYTVDEEFTGVSVRTDRTDVIFKPSEDGKVKVVCEEREKVRHSVSVENGTLTVSAVDRREWYDYLAVFSKHLTMTVYLPSGEYDSLNVKTDTGSVSVPSDFSFGAADVTTATGKIEFRAAEGGTLKLRSSTGSVTAEGCAAESVDVSTSTGKVVLYSVDCEGTVSVKVSTGRTELADVTCKNFGSDGSTGSVTLKNVVASGKISIERATGSVTFDKCDAAEITVKTSTGSVKGSLLSEKVFVAKSSTGRVSVPDSITGGRCEITTSTGNIEITVKK